MVLSTDNLSVTSEQDAVPVNPNRVGMYLTPAERAMMQSVAERLTANGVEGLLDKDGNLIIKALVKHLVNQEDERLNASLTPPSASP